MEQPRGQYRIIRMDGTSTVIHERPTIKAIHKAIGCDCLDTVILDQRDSRPSFIMLVDDTGMIDGRPVNALATAIAREAFGPSYYPYSIHGDVVIAHDEDFA